MTSSPLRPAPSGRAAMGGRRRPWRDHLPLAFLSVAAGAVANSYVLNTVPASVSTEAGLHDVSFGWPLPWVAQDHSGTGYMDFPVTIGFVSYKYGPEIPTSYDWLAFTADAAAIALIAFPVLTVLLRLIVRRRAARLKERS
ncbi:hypothetical protein J2Y69_000676 [Microbacterium resistens]|uniref:DUF4328 domain-containing protein n=1 Tax=Microbacterium resistens TaxID=156977 RepID=A0ABU1S919_9MICO|nr:hypothetical protein [Microbacterium resistens]MDR6866091.1 hypothetical protein [Microbacterium resistens]